MVPLDGKRGPWTQTVGAALLVCALALPGASCGPAERGTAESPGAESSGEGYLAGAGGVRLYYRVLGSGPDTAVVVHGGPGAGMNAILPHVEALARSRALILYDQRGGGRSELPEDTALLHARYHVGDLEAVRRHFGLDRLSIVAHSFGAILVAAYARQHPDRIERLVFLSGATGPRRAAAAAAARAEQESTDSVLEARMREVIRELLTGAGDDPVALCREYERLRGELVAARGLPPSNWRGSTCEAPPEAVRYYYHYTARLSPRTFGDWDFTENLAGVSAPLLVLHGARDTAGVAAAKSWARALPQGRVLSVADARSPIADRPEVTLAAIEEFLDGRWPQGAERPDPIDRQP